MRYCRTTSTARRIDSDIIIPGANFTTAARRPSIWAVFVWRTATRTSPSGPSRREPWSANAGRTNLLDYLNYAVTRPDLSYGSYPDGAVSGRRVFYYTTPASTNNPAS